MGFDEAKARGAIAAFLEAVGHPTSSDTELAQTPERVTDAFVREFLSGYSSDVGALIREARTQSKTSSVICLRGIRVATTCPHHLMPAVGTADVAYLPRDCAIGFGGVVAVVDALARRLTLQERLGEDIAKALVEEIPARGAWVRLELVHTCVSARRSEQHSEGRVLTIAQLGEPIAGAAEWRGLPW